MKQLKVLAVDDDPRYLELLEFTLIGEGFDVRTVKDPRMVQSIAAVEQPDVIVTDVTMPNLDGYALAAGLRSDSRTAEIPLIFLTARAQNGDRLEALKIGGVEYLMKPFSITDLVTSIHRASASVHKDIV